MLKSYSFKLLALLLAVGMTAQLAAQSALQIDSPASIAGTYYTSVTMFSGSTFGQSGAVVLADDGDVTGTGGTTTDGCQAITSDVNGKIALIDRGVCALAVKALNAQNAGAIAIVVCQNAANAAQAPFSSVGNAGVPITIPVMFMGKADCDLIKTELATGITGTIVEPKANQTAVAATDIGVGVHSAPVMDGGFGRVFGATAPGVPVHGLWYRFTSDATQNTLVSVNSCGGGADTRLFILPGSTAQEAADAALAGAALGFDDECDEGGGLGLASDAQLIVDAGTTFYIHWDDNWGPGPFTFEITESALPTADVTFTVDMQYETVAGDGVKISVNGGPEENMTDNGDGTWSYTGNYVAGTVLTWLFSNGAGNVEADAANLEVCRAIQVGVDPLDVPTTCYNSCFVCPPPVACPNWIDDDFESYSLSTIGNQASDDAWTTWSLAPGGTDDAVVSNAQALSGAQSLNISNAGGDDVLLQLGNRTSGNFILKWKMYIPTGSSGYYNTQKIQASPGTEFGMQVEFLAAGSGTLDAGAADVKTFTYPYDTWFEVYHQFDLDNNWARLWINGKAVYEWPANWGTFVQTGLQQLGAVNFYGNTGNNFYVDDVLFKEVEPCPADAIICDGYDGYDVGELGGQSPWYDTWTPGSATEDGLVSQEQFLSCEQSLKISNAGGDDQLMILGLRTAGNYWLSWDMYVPAGSAGYYNIQKQVTAATTNAGFAMAAHFNADGTGDVDAGAASAFSFTYPQDVWFNVGHQYDLDNGIATLYIDGIQVASWPSNLTASQGAGANAIGSVDFYGDAGNLYYVDNSLFVQLPSVPGDVCSGAIDLNSYFGQGVGTVVNTPLYDNTNYATDDSDPLDGWDCFGEPDGGGATPSLENTIWFEFAGDGETYTITTAPCNATDYIEDGDTQMAIYSGTSCANLTPVACNEDLLPSGPPYPAGLELATVAGTNYYMMIDGFNLGNGQAISAGEFCVQIEQLTGTIPTYDVTLEVDMKRYIEDGGTISPEGLHVAGSFQGWDPAATPMTQVAGTDKWTVTLDLEAGTYEYKFVNGNAWGTCDVAQECLVSGQPCGTANNDNRSLTVVGNMTAANCYDACGVCLSSTEDVAFSQAITMQPNPADSYVNVIYNFEQAADLNIRLVNSLGQLVNTQTLDKAQNGSLRLDLSSLPAGAYNVVFSNGNSVATKRLIVK